VERAGGSSRKEGNKREPWRLFDMEVSRSLRIQVESFQNNRHSSDERRTAAEIGSIHSQAVWLIEGALHVARWDVTFQPSRREHVR